MTQKNTPTRFHTSRCIRQLLICVCRSALKFATFKNMNPSDLSKRLLHFSVTIIDRTKKLSQFNVDSVIIKQVVRSGTSPGANYQEACAATSRRDCIYKLQTVLKELRETNYWLDLIDAINDKPQISLELNKVRDENKYLTNIIAKSIVTAKQNDYTSR